MNIMMSSRLPSSSELSDTNEELRHFIEELLLQPHRESVGSELEVLQSIYGENAIRLWHPSTQPGVTREEGNHAIRYEVVLR